MNLDKAKARIAKQVKKGDKGYPKISLAYFGETSDFATQVVVEFVFDAGAEAQQEKFMSKIDAREDEVIQSALVKIIERANASTVTEVEGVAII